MTTTHILKTAEADIAYDVHGPLPTADGRPPLLMIGQPMTASGFATLISHFPDRTVVTYDPRGLGRSTRTDGRVDNSPTIQAHDVHDVIGALDAGPVEMFGLAMATAVFLDAIVIRLLLLPAVLQLLGRTTWVLPGWLDRRLPRVAIDAEPAPRPRPTLEPALEAGS